MKPLSTQQRRIAIGVFAMMATAITFALMEGPFGYSSVCDKCGALRRATDWQLPLTEFTVYTHSSESDSPLSRVLLTNGIVQAHPHHWLFVHGGGNGVRCAIGPGRHVRPAAESEDFAELVLVLHQQGQIAFRDRVVRGAFDPDTTDVFRSMSFNVPKDRMSATELPYWIAEKSRHLDLMVTANKRK